VTLPSLSIDGKPTVESIQISSRINDFYGDLKNRQSFFYRALHYYMRVLLLTRWWPPAFVAKQFLSVGNPDTQFLYGTIDRHEALEVSLDPTLLRSHDAYFTIYNRASFPVDWGRITEPRFKSRTSPETGFYLIRIHQRVATASTGASADALESNVLVSVG
jgi:hypothetical protein